MSKSAAKTGKVKKGSLKYQGLFNIWLLGIKEFWSLIRDPIMLVLIVYIFVRRKIEVPAYGHLTQLGGFQRSG